jgi:hypothetical protein
LYKFGQLSIGNGEAEIPQSLLLHGERDSGLTHPTGLFLIYSRRSTFIQMTKTVICHILEHEDIGMMGLWEIGTADMKPMK